MICTICSGTKFQQSIVLKKRLIEEWKLAKHEVDYVNKQQGYRCANCGSNMRSMTLADSIVKFFNYNGNFQHFTLSRYRKKLHVLEINAAGNLHHYLSNFKHYTFAQYPQVDMQQMAYPDNSFDFIVHSDTLEHVEDSKQALNECLRVLKPGGALFYTVPIIYERLTKRRDGLPDSFHGNQDESQGYDYKVFVEYGADFWVEMMQAGYKDIHLNSLGDLSSIGIIGIKNQMFPDYANSSLSILLRFEFKMKQLIKLLIRKK